VLTKNGDEYSSGESVFPFKLDTGIPECAEPLTLSARPVAIDCKCHTEGEKMLCEADISLPYSVTREKSIRIAEDIKAENKENERTPKITVYYPTEKETLWSVAKRFGVSLRSLAEANDLPSLKGEEPLSQKHFIMIY